MEGTLENNASSNSPSLAAPLILLFVFALELISMFLERHNKRGLKSAEEVKLQQEIKELLKEASSLSTPSTFAQAAKLRRAAAAKEKELLKIQESHNKGKKGSNDLYLQALGSLKVVTYLGLTWWFWGVPLAAIPQQLLQPFGKALSWRAGESIPGYVMIGVIPWLVLTARVSKFLCQRLPKSLHFFHS
ncbi:protein GET1 isoform X1 [Magnolia sinica]|uniref:protein GET1 isoform X1 n=1 Tax=Magnolia sinica TaxID=86752 RepID=UPI00265868F8|nr:protein GET1 isoform X1 [Magnolia sinica]